MTRTIPIRLMTRQWGERAIKIRPHWAGQGIAIHKPVALDENGQPIFLEAQGLWHLTHIPTGLNLGSCMGSLDRAKRFARAWDAEFAVRNPHRTMASDRQAAWMAVVEEMRTEPPRRKPGQAVTKVEAG